MIVLIACEYSGRVRDAFTARGHSAVSCDLLPSDTPGPHVQGDALILVKQKWDLVIAFPPCTDLAASNAHNLKIKAADGRTDRAEQFFMACYNANAPKVCVENPAGVMSTRFRKPDQYVDPWWFGDPWNKRTGLWLRGLPKLVPTHEKPDNVRAWHHGSGKQVNGVRTFDGSGCASTAHARSITFQGLANAMAAQWG